MQNKGFNPRTYIRYDSILLTFAYMVTSFNPRTYIRYDELSHILLFLNKMFQSTYLYKVRLQDLSALVGHYVVSIHVPI